MSFRRGPANFNASLRCAGWFAAVLLAWGLVPRSALAVTGTGVYSCTVSVSGGTDACEMGGGSWAVVPFAEITPTTTVLKCDVAVGPWLSCGQAGGSSSFALYGDVGDYDFIDSTGEGMPFDEYVVKAAVAYVAAGGGGGGGSGTIEDFDLAVGGSMFAAAFVIVGMFWALGKGVGAVVNSVRRF